MQQSDTKSYKSDKLENASFSNHNIGSSSFVANLAAVLSSKEYGTDHSVAKEIEEGLDALLQCVNNVGQQLQSKTSVQSVSDKSQTTQPVTKIMSSGNDNAACERKSTTQLSECNSTSSQAQISVTDLKLSTLGIQSDSLHTKNGNKSSQIEEVKRKKDDGITPEVHHEKCLSPSPSENGVSEGNAFGASEISNENYVFSSLSLVDKDYLDNAALNEINQEGLSVLSEITEKYATSPASVAPGSNDLTQSMNQLYSFNTASMISQPHVPSHFNQIPTTVISKKAVLPIVQHCVQEALEKETLNENDFSDFSEASVRDVGLSGDTYLTIMHALDHSESSKHPKVPLRCKKMEVTLSPSKSITGNITVDLERSLNSEYHKPVNTSCATETEINIRTKIDKITKTVSYTSRDLVVKGNEPIKTRKLNAPNNNQRESNDNEVSNLLNGEKIPELERPVKISEVDERVDENSNVTKLEESEADSVKLVPEVPSSSIASSTNESESYRSGDESSVLSSDGDISDPDATLCDDRSSDCESVMEVTPTKNSRLEANLLSESPIGTSETEAQAFLVRSSSLPHNEDACDGLTDCPANYDVQSTGGSFHSTLANQAEAATEQSISLGYHSYSPFEDSIETDILPLNSRMGNAPCVNKDTSKVVQALCNLPKPVFEQRKPIKLKINLRKGQCTLMNESIGDFVDSTNVFMESEQRAKGNVTPCNRKISTSASPCTWVATPPKGLKLKLTKIQGTPKSEIRSPLSRIQNTPKLFEHSPSSNNKWSVHRSGDLKLKFSSSKLTRETVEHSLAGSRPSTPKHSLEHSPPGDGEGRPNKRRRKLTYEPGTLRW